MLSKKVKELTLTGKRLSNLLVAFTFAAAIGLILAPHPAKAWGTDNQHQLIPLYTYPDWYSGSSSSWIRACSEANASGIGSTIIANLGVDYAGHTPTASNANPYYPGGGPGAPATSQTAFNGDMATAIGWCHDKGQNVVGYVDTNYSSRPLAEVEADIDAWYARYVQTPTASDQTVYDLTAPYNYAPDNGVAPDSRIDGIFFDQVSSSNTVTAGVGSMTVGQYYRTLFNYVKAKDSTHTFDDVIANPGVAVSTDWMLHDYGTVTQIADEVVLFEGSETDFANYTPASWMSGWPSQDKIALIYNVPSTDLQTVCSSTKTTAKGAFGTVFVTDGTSTLSAWQNYPSSTYLSSERSYCG